MDERFVLVRTSVLEVLIVQLQASSPADSAMQWSSGAVTNLILGAILLFLIIHYVEIQKSDSTEGPPSHSAPRSAISALRSSGDEASSIVTTFPTTSSPSIVIIEDASSAYPKVSYEDLDLLNDLYYQNQLKERGCDRGKELLDLVPQFACTRGVIPIGSSTLESVVDGHKWACGVHAISSAPIVYSFGSAKNQVFEESFLKLRPDAKIFVFEIKAEALPAERIPSVEYHVMGLGYQSDVNFKSLRAIMKSLSHQYIDVLKMDIEGFEWDFIREEANLLPHIGQWLVELHLGPTSQTVKGSKGHGGPGSARGWLETVEGKDMRLFFKELNTNNDVKCYNPMYYTELSFIQKKWGAWDRNKKSITLS